MAQDSGKYHRKRTYDKIKDNFSILCKDAKSSGLIMYIDPNGKLKSWCE